MRRAKIEVEERPAADGEIAALARDAGLRLGQETRRGNGTAAKPRGGRHNKLSPEEKAERQAKRDAGRRERQQEAESLRDTARGRAARRRRDQEDERAGRRRRPIRATIEEKDRPRVTAAGGRKLERKPKGDGGGRSRSSIEREAKLRALVLKLKARCLGGKGQGAWRAGELANFLRYLTRSEGLAGSPSAAIVTNIVAPEIAPGTDAFVQRLFGCGLAIEQVEREVDPKGQVYRHLTVPLPHGIGADGRRAIADGYARALAKRGLLYLIAIHAPSPGGDQRNDHLHIAVISRPGERSGDYAWSFSASKDRLLFSPAMMRVWRRFSVVLFNDQLQRAGSATRYTLEPAIDPEIARGRVATAQLRERANAAENRLERAHRDRDAAVRISDMAARLVVVGRSLETAATRSATLIQRATGDLLGPLRQRAIAMRAANAAAIGHGAALLERSQSVAQLRAIRRKIAFRMFARPDPALSASFCARQALVAKRDRISLRPNARPTRTAAITGLRMVRRRTAMKSLINIPIRHDALDIARRTLVGWGNQATGRRFTSQPRSNATWVSADLHAIRKRLSDRTAEQTKPTGSSLAGTALASKRDRLIHIKAPDTIGPAVVNALRMVRRRAAMVALSGIPVRRTVNSIGRRFLSAWHDQGGRRPSAATRAFTAILAREALQAVLVRAIAAQRASTTKVAVEPASPSTAPEAILRRALAHRRDRLMQGQTKRAASGSSDLIAIGLDAIIERIALHRNPTSAVDPISAMRTHSRHGSNPIKRAEVVVGVPALPAITPAPATAPSSIEAPAPTTSKLSDEEFVRRIVEREIRRRAEEIGRVIDGANGPKAVISDDPKHEDARPINTASVEARDLMARVADLFRGVIRRRKARSDAAAIGIEFGESNSDRGDRSETMLPDASDQRPQEPRTPSVERGDPGAMDRSPKLSGDETGRNADDRPEQLDWRAREAFIAAARPHAQSGADRAADERSAGPPAGLRRLPGGIVVQDADQAGVLLRSVPRHRVELRPGTDPDVRRPPIYVGEGGSRVEPAKTGRRAKPASIVARTRPQRSETSGRAPQSPSTVVTAAVPAAPDRYRRTEPATPAVERPGGKPADDAQGANPAVSDPSNAVDAIDEELARLLALHAALRGKGL